MAGVKALSFADDISWWAEGKADKEVAEKLGKASEAAVAWGGKNGVTFDHGKSEAVLFSRKRKMPTGTTRVGGKRNPIQHRGDTLAGNMAGLPPHAEGSSEDDDEERKEGTS